MRKEYLLPGLAVVGGAAGLALRRWQLTTALEPDTGLPIAGRPATYAFWGLTILMAALLILLSVKMAKGIPASYNEVFRCRSFGCLLAVSAAGFLTVIAGVFALTERVETGMRLLKVLLGLFLVLSGGCILVIGKSNYRGEGKGTRSLLLLAPPFACCIWLLSSYRGWARDPVLRDYAVMMLAIMCGMMAHYFIACLSFEKARGVPACAAGLLAVYFSLATLTDGHTRSDLLLLAALILYMTASVYALLRQREPESAGQIPSADSENPEKEDLP